MTKRATLRDVAAACGVSSALVSVVLNGKEGRIGCAEPCRKKIRETAEKMGYVPNSLARSMSLGRPPVAAVVMHMEDTDLCSGSYAYFNELFPVLTLALNARDIEVLFVPCRDSAEQLARLDRIIRGGLAGAVISNIVPGDYDGVTRRIRVRCGVRGGSFRIAFRHDVFSFRWSCGYVYGSMQILRETGSSPEWNHAATVSAAISATLLRRVPGLIR